MRKPLTNRLEVTVDSGRKYHFIGPRGKLKPLLTVLNAFDFRDAKGAGEPMPWREALKADLEKHGEVAAVLRGARLKEGLSQAALARKIGTTQGNVSQMEAGLRPLGKRMAQRLSLALKINYRVFL